MTVSGRPATQAASTAAVKAELRAQSFTYFLSEIVDPAGRRLQLPVHLLHWAELVAAESRLVLCAPRDHAKSTLLLAYTLWQFLRHARAGQRRGPASARGTFEAVLLSATRAQADDLMARFRDLLLANSALFEGVDGPQSATDRRLGARWSQGTLRLASGASLRIRPYRSSTRGLHPDLLLLDDVQNDANTLSSHQRERTYRYLLDTLLPMHPRQLLIVGTRLHQADLLQRLGPDGRGGRPPFGFRWLSYRALDEASGEALWPERHPASELLALRDADPVMFSKEYQNDPRDDAASMFPHEYTERAIEAGRHLTFTSGPPDDPDELAVLGADIALSEAAGADYTVAMVVAYNRRTQRRRLLTARRVKGLDFGEQVALIRDLVSRHGVTIGVVEQNGFQRWLVDELQKWPETRGHIFGNTTGRAKADQRDGIPRVKLELVAGNWVMASGDAECLRFARIWQAELGAFGFRDGRLEGVGEHDDSVIATWYVELAIRLVEQVLGQGPEWEIVTGEDLGIEPVIIGEPYPEDPWAAARLRQRYEAW